MSSSEKSPLQRLVSAAWAVLLIAVLLWVAVSLFQQIWPWLLGAVLIAATVWLLTAIRRWRRDRW